tara:strand:+ start:4992 stop:5303 length:312 start_codon:yes stop_codon:yes gene_type:complete
LKYLKKKMKTKLLLLIPIFFLNFACSDLTGKNLRKSNEFLIEKKNPLVMPPDINDLPKPAANQKTVDEDNNFKETLKSKNIESETLLSEDSSSIEKSIIKKID